MSSTRRVEYLPLTDLEPDPRNPKRHDVNTINESIGRFGVLDLIVRDERTGRIVSGHGRAATLTAQHARGETPPDGVQVTPTGEWLVPVVTGWASRSDADARAALIALNRTTELGGWDDTELLTLLDELAEADALDGVGFDTSDIDALRDQLDELDQDPVPPGDGNPYTRVMNAPQYEPTSPVPPPVTALYDQGKAAELVAAVNAADLPPDLRGFLTAAAYRHTVFNYAQIAEYYAHSPAPVQRLMEASALVIVDFDDAMRNGYVRLSTRLEELLDPTARDRDDL